MSVIFVLLHCLYISAILAVRYAAPIIKYFTLFVKDGLPREFRIKFSANSRFLLLVNNPYIPFLTYPVSES